MLINFLKHVKMAINLKKKVGRPKKDSQQNLEMDLQTIIDVKNEIIYDLEARLDISNREQEQMLVELNRNVEMLKYHCARVEDETGSLTSQDINYSANLLLRIMNYKFEFKPANWEE
jgi:hypothetical protein